MRLLFYFLIVSFFVLPSMASAACFSPKGKRAIKDSDLIFKGVAGSTQSSQDLLKKKYKNKINYDSYTSFKINDLVKGGVNDNVKILHNVDKGITTANKNFKKGEQYVVFANRYKLNRYSVHGCDPLHRVKNLKDSINHTTQDTLIAIAKFQGYKQELNKLINLYGDKKFFIEKISLLEKYKDYEQARLMYKKLIKTSYQKYQQGVNKHGKRYGVTDKNNICTGPFSVKKATPKFLKKFPVPTSNERYLNYQDRKYLLGYGRALFYLDRHKAALRPLCLAGDVDDAQKWRTRTLAKLGYTSHFPEKIDLSNTELEDIDLSGLNLARSDFSNSAFKNLNIKNANLKAANLQNTDFGRVKADGVNLSSANLKGANLKDAALEGGKFKNALYDEATKWPEDFKPQKYGAKLMTKDKR